MALSVNSVNSVPGTKVARLSLIVWGVILLPRTISFLFFPTN